MGAHYGLAFLLLKEGDLAAAESHLRRFLEAPPDRPEASGHVEHARATLDRLERKRTENVGS